MIPTFLREVLSKENIPREPEPDLIMENKEQVSSYALAGRIDGVMSASYLFQTARITKTIYGKKKVLDLGCGPGTQLAQIAQLNPESSFTGMDLSEEMLEDAENHRKELDLQNIKFEQGNFSNLKNIEDHSFDAVISTMALHHLPSISDLKNCFMEIKRILKPGGAIYLTDFSRLKSLKSVLFFAYLNKQHQPHLFSLDYERSLRAAFLLSDFQSLSKELLPDNTQIISTFGIPILLITKSADVKIPDTSKEALKQMRQNLPLHYRRELDDIRLFFWLSGLRHDPF